MSVFISWSGKDTQSHQVAQQLREWLPKVIQRLKCFLSSHDIEGGGVWYETLSKNLASSKVGILCLTSDSATRPWLLFEAGVVAKAMDQQKVYPLMIGLEPSELPGPLTVFQGGGLQKDDMYKLVQMVNEAAGENSLDDGALNESFENRWPEFERATSKIKTKKGDSAAASPQIPAWQAALQETLSLVRGIAGGTIPVHSKPLLPVPKAGRFAEAAIRQLGFSSAPTRSETHLGNNEGRKIHKELCDNIAAKRPLLGNWVGVAYGAHFRDGRLTLTFDPSESHAADSLARPDKKAFLLGLLDGLGVTDIDFQICKKGPDEE